MTHLCRWCWMCAVLALFAPWALLPGSLGQSASAAEAGESPRTLKGPEGRAKRLEAPGREVLAKPDEVLAALRLQPGQVVGDVGAGTGYFARRFARAVGPAGLVYAVDIEPYMIDELTKRATAEGITNIVPILARPDNSLLPEASCDLVFLGSVYAVFGDRIGYLRHLITRLKPNGRVAVIGWKKGGRPQVGPVGDENRLTAEQVTDELTEAGFVVLENLLVIPDKYFVIAGLQGGGEGASQ